LTIRRSIGSVIKNISYSYNVNGSVATISYPGGFTLWNEYSAVGRLLNIRNSDSTLYYAKSATYAPQGALSGLTLGWTSLFAGIKLDYTYNSRMQPLMVRASHTNYTVTLLSLTYSFVQAGGINNGTPVSITNALSSGRTQYFTYDEMNRLKTAYSSANSGSDCWGQSFSYDRYGNLSTISQTKCSPPTLSLSIDSGTNQITNSGFGYDAAGNLTGTGFDTYTYNAAGLMASNSGTAYTYDASGQRTKKQNGNLYWYGKDGEVLEETDSSGSVISDYIYFNGRRIARRDASGTMYYYITDHIGNVRLMANASGTVVEESDYLPFGTENVITSTITNNYKFIGMERDYEGNAALDHTLYREYAPNLARWTTPDPVHGTPANPQSWNRYPYVLNDPLTKIDPLGNSPGYDALLVGCLPDVGYVAGTILYGCGWDPDYDECPPGTVAIYGTPNGTRYNQRPAIENAQSLLQYADARLSPYYSDEGLLTYGLGPDGTIHVNFASVGESIDLGDLWDIQNLGDFIDWADAIVNSFGPTIKGVGTEACTAYPEDTATGRALRWICEHFPEDRFSNSMRACLILLYDPDHGGYINLGPPFPPGLTEDYGIAAHAICALYAITHPDSGAK
jgi:RHS repeat-associated protein